MYIAAAVYVSRIFYGIFLRVERTERTGRVIATVKLQALASLPQAKGVAECGKRRWFFERHIFFNITILIRY